jgi:hypothetical protein
MSAAPSASASTAPAASVGRPPALSGAGVADPVEFGAWRGKPVEVWETWNNFRSWGEMESLPSVKGNFLSPRFAGRMSFSQPMWAAGENAGTCASGASDAHMRAVFTNLKQMWSGDAYVRLGWEMNGYWFAQNYAPADPAGWVRCWQRWYGIIKDVSPGFKLVWNPNFDSNTNGRGDFDVRTVWPGDRYVDAAGPDYYDWNIDPDRTGSGGAPFGINQWLAFVASHGKPFASPEWGLNTPNGGGDDAGFIQQMHDAFQRAAASPSGLEYESYFSLDGCVFQVHVGGCNPAATAKYRELF